jgi:predicted secreted hydrolase
MSQDQIANLATVGTPNPTPVPPEKRSIKLPQDHYLHPGAPTEWWWHTGTLVAGKDVYGFEINAANLFGYGFTQVSLSDVAHKTHYQQTKPLIPTPAPEDWAESNPSKPWYVRLENVQMKTFGTSPYNPSNGMQINARLDDDKTKRVVNFSLELRQDGPTFLQWGTGVQPYPPGPVTDHNYYYSLTRLRAKGSVSILGTEFPVAGMTWMDHEYGAFGSGTNFPTWLLQDIQLKNGVHLSNYAMLNEPPELGKPIVANVTIQTPDDKLYFLERESILTPFGRTWESSMGTVFFMQFRIQIPSFGADLRVDTLMDEQDFPIPPLADTYEGVARVEGSFDRQPVLGTAWSEQNLKTTGRAARMGSLAAYAAQAAPAETVPKH